MLDWPTSWNWINPTRCIGLAVYAASIVACALAGRASARRAERSSRQFWLALAGVHLLLLADMALSVRHGISAYLGEIARSGQWYSLRHRPQFLAVVATGAMAALASLALLWRLRQRHWPAKLAVVGTLLSITSFVLSCISLHDVDAVMYRRLGPTMVVAGVWMTAGTLVVVGAVASRRGRAITDPPTTRGGQSAG